MAPISQLCVQTTTSCVLEQTCLLSRHYDMSLAEKLAFFDASPHPSVSMAVFFRSLFCRWEEGSWALDECVALISGLSDYRSLRCPNRNLTVCLQLQ